VVATVVDLVAAHFAAIEPAHLSKRDRFLRRQGGFDVEQAKAVEIAAFEGQRIVGWRAQHLHPTANPDDRDARGCGSVTSAARPVARMVAQARTVFFVPGSTRPEKA